MYRYGLKITFSYKESSNPILYEKLLQFFIHLFFLWCIILESVKFELCSKSSVKENKSADFIKNKFERGAIRE